jgi:hypothetical protein
MDKRIVALSLSLIVAISLGNPLQAVAKKGGGKKLLQEVTKIGGGKNASHGRKLEDIQHKYRQAQDLYSKPAANKKALKKQATKLRNVIKTLGKTIRGENHSQKPKG